MKQEARPSDGLESPGFSRGEEVKHPHHTLHPTHRADQPRNKRTHRHRAVQRDHTALHRHGHPRQVELPAHNLPLHRLPQLTVRDEIDTQQVRTADNTQQLPVLSHHRQPFNPVTAHPLGSLPRRRTLRDRDRGRAHQIPRNRLLGHVTREHRLIQVRRGKPGQQVTLGDHPHHPLVGVQHRKRAHPVHPQRHSESLKSRLLERGHNMRGHQVADSAGHGHPFTVRPPSHPLPRLRPGHSGRSDRR